MQDETIDILLVEDNQADVELIRVMLETPQSSRRRFEISVADSLSAANERLENGHFHIVLLDLGLPDSFGIETLRAFLNENAVSPVVVLTGHTDEEMAVQAVNDGAQDFLLKDGLDARLLRRSIRYCIERHRLEREQRWLSAQLLNVLSNEQQRIARELHDEVGQGLAGLNMMARILARKLRQRDPEEAETSQLISEGIQDVLDSFRHVLCGLSPVDIDEQGLRIALARLCETIQKTGVDCSFDCDERFVMHDHAIATHLYRIAQESLTNAMRHAQAEQLHLRLERIHGSVLLTISDNGCGFDPAVVEAGSMGLRILQHRTALIGGALAITSGSTGTTVTCEVELDGTAANY